MTIPAITSAAAVAVPTVERSVTVPIPQVTAGVSTGFDPPFSMTINNGDTGFTLRLVNGVTYNFQVWWGDGTSDTITTWNQAETTHTYADAGEYTLWVMGIMPELLYTGSSSAPKILRVNSFGPIRWTAANSMFRTCSNMTFCADGGDFSEVVGAVAFISMFSGCTSLTAAPLLNMRGVGSADCSSMFSGCTALVEVPAIQFPAAGSTFTNLFLNCSSLLRIGSARITTPTTNTFSGCTALEDVLATGISTTTSFENCNMGAAALNQLFELLEPVSAKTITITGNPGAGTCNQAIATAKGWTVVN